MGKFRSKVKGQSKGKRWPKGQSSSSNPSVQKYRNLAKSRFFQENLGNSNLTQEAVQKHNAITLYGHGDNKVPNFDNELAIAMDLENMAIEGNNLFDTESQAEGSSNASTFQTFQTFASDWSSCSNVSFSKLLTRFNMNNALHKEMLAILAAVTEVIKEQGGTDSNTAYFAALIETLKSTDTDDGMAATLSLLSMGMKSVPQPVLRIKFSDTANILTTLLQKYAHSDHGMVLRCLIGCLSILLRAQEYALWGESSTIKVFESVLAFVIHSKPKIRKAAQHAVCAIIRGCCFMLPTEEQPKQVVKLHPGANKVANLCQSHMTAEALLESQITVLHTLTLLKEVIGVFSKDNIKVCCESLLSLMTHNNIIVKTSCLQVLYNLFASQNDNSHLTATLTVQLIRALTASRPGAGDNRQNLAWVMVMQQAFVCLATMDLDACIHSLPGFVNICVSELWLCDAPEVTNATTNALKAILMDCVKPAIASPESVQQYKSSIEPIFNSIRTGLNNPFNQAIKHVILTIAVCFEIGTDHVKPTLALMLKQLNERKESYNFNHVKEAEYATGCAVKALGPEFVLTCIPIKRAENIINVDRTWLLPILKDKVQNATLKYFTTDILELAFMCRKNAVEFEQRDERALSHTYDLLCGQFWSLLPSFCNSPPDVKDSFKNIARILGNVIKDNPEFRPFVMHGLRKLITSSANKVDKSDEEELSRFAKNFLPRLLNVYMTPASGSHAEGQRLGALETLQVYLTISPNSLREELYSNALEQLSSEEKEHFKREALLDIIRILVLYQTEEKIAHLFDKWVYPLCETPLEDGKFKKKRLKKDKKSGDKMEEAITEDDTKAEMHWKDRMKMIEMEHKKAYRILDEIFKCEKDNCKAFLEQSKKGIQKLLIGSLNKAADSSKATRLRCIENLIKITPNLTHESKILQNAVPEAVICTKDINAKCRQCAFNLLNTIGEALTDAPGGLSAFVGMLEAGLEGPPKVMNASILALASATYNFSGALGIESLQRVLENVCKLVISPSREIVSACLSYLKVYTKTLPSPAVAGSLPLIFTSLSSMTDDCKKHARVELGRFLCRMMRKYGSDTIDKLIPQTDEIMHKRLKNLRKAESRNKRQKELRKSRGPDQDDDMDIKVKGSSVSLDELLKDSDSELDIDEDDTKSAVNLKNKKTKGGRKNKSWIQDDPENIVDLTDISAARRITATDPSLMKMQEADTRVERRQRKQGFKVAADGRLIISDKFMRGDDSESDTEKLRKRNLSNSDDSDSEAGAKSVAMKAGKKRKFEDAMSLRSGKTARTQSSHQSQPASKYKTGGKGIHRPISSTSAPYTKAGSEYRSKKSLGDVKKKGKPDPYAYLPLVRTALNKRRKVGVGQQFKGIIKNKKKGVKPKAKSKNRK